MVMPFKIGHSYIAYSVKESLRIRKSMSLFHNSFALLVSIKSALLRNTHTLAACMHHTLTTLNECFVNPNRQFHMRLHFCTIIIHFHVTHDVVYFHVMHSVSYWPPITTSH